jgi:hypothetical protein
MPYEICIRQLAGMACDRSEFRQLSVTGKWARYFSPFRHPSDSKSADTEFEHEELMMFGNNGDLPDCDVIVANFLGSELDGVKVNDDLTMMVIYHPWRPSLLITMSWKRMQPV